MCVCVCVCECVCVLAPLKDAPSVPHHDDKGGGGGGCNCLWQGFIDQDNIGDWSASDMGLHRFVLNGVDLYKVDLEEPCV